MATFVALLRGINVGKAKRIQMADLKALMVSHGFTNVTTLLNSGNVVFQATQDSTTALARAIANAIAGELKLEVPVIVKSGVELAEAVAENPYSDPKSDPSQLLVAFAQEPETLQGLKVIETLVIPPEAFSVGRAAAYLHCAKGILESKAGEALLGKVGKGVTTRNWATVLKLQALVNKSPA